MSTRLKIFISAICIAVMAMFFCDVQQYSAVFVKGVSIWANNVLPTILPFMLASGIASKSGGIELIFGKTNLSSKLFSAPKNTDWLMVLSLICGYPVGAKLIAEQHKNGLDTNACIKLATFCTTASPIFVVATVGITYLQSTKAALILITSHVVASILNGLAYKNMYQLQCTLPKSTSKTNLFSAVIESVNSILCVGALIALFYTLCSMICNVLPKWFNTDGLLVTSFLLGLLEMTTGCINVSQIANTFTATVLCCALISFGGLCVIMQMMTFLADCKIKTSTIVLTKVTHCAFSTIICFILGKLFCI